MKWWTDADFAVHPDLKSHSGILGSLGREAIFAKSVTQKLNTTSSTESEVVAGLEALAQALWTTSFLKHQGYNVKNALLNQDNQTVIRLHENGVMSRKKGSRHIDIRFFFLKDRIDTGEVEIAFCGTENMVADFLSKPLQGGVFRRFRDAIMGCKRKATTLSASFSFDRWYRVEKVAVAFESQRLPSLNMCHKVIDNMCFRHTI